MEQERRRRRAAKPFPPHIFKGFWKFAIVRVMVLCARGHKDDALLARRKREWSKRITSRLLRLQCVSLVKEAGFPLSSLSFDFIRGLMRVGGTSSLCALEPVDHLPLSFSAFVFDTTLAAQLSIVCTVRANIFGVWKRHPKYWSANNFRFLLPPAHHAHSYGWPN